MNYEQRLHFALKRYIGDYKSDGETVGQILKRSGVDVDRTLGKISLLVLGGNFAHQISTIRNSQIKN